MKALSYPIVALTLVLAACGKSKPLFHGSGPTGNWLLSKKTQTFGPSGSDITPARDSSVVLTLNSDSTYISRLNNKIVSRGAYSFTRDTGSTYRDGTLVLKDFKTTGIFGLLYLYQMGTNGQVLSVYFGLSMKISDNTMTLTSTITPGGYSSYLFTRE